MPAGSPAEDGTEPRHRAPRYVCRSPDRRHDVHKDQIEGAGKQAKGAIKDAAGKATGNGRLQAEGKMDKAAGKIQSTVGKVKDTARKELKR